MAILEADEGPLNNSANDHWPQQCFCKSLLLDQRTVTGMNTARKELWYAITSITFLGSEVAGLLQFYRVWKLSICKKADSVGMMASEVHTFQGLVQKYDAMHSLKRQCTSKRNKMCYIEGILHSKKSPWSFTVENGLAIEGNSGSQMGQEKL